MRTTTQTATAANIRRGMRVVYRGEPRTVTYSQPYGSTWQLDFTGGWRAFVDPQMELQVVGRAAILPDRRPRASRWTVAGRVLALVAYLAGMAVIMAAGLGMFA